MSFTYSAVIVNVTIASSSASHVEPATARSLIFARQYLVISSHLNGESRSAPEQCIRWSTSHRHVRSSVFILSPCTRFITSDPVAVPGTSRLTPARSTPPRGSNRVVTARPPRVSVPSSSRMQRPPQMKGSSDSDFLR